MIVIDRPITDAKCHIAGAAPFYRKKPCVKPGDMIIAADGGFARLNNQGLKPDIILGDFDSLPEIPTGDNVIRLSREKDDTDLFFAIKLGFSRGYKLFDIYGGAGGRFDHTLANLQCLAWLAEHNARGFLHGNGFDVTVIMNGNIAFDSGRKGYISIFAYGGPALGVTLKGLKFGLTDANLEASIPIGVSNEFTGGECLISVRDGAVAVVWETDGRLLR